MRSSKHKDLVAGLVLLILSAAYFAMSFRIRLTSIDRLVGSRFFPQVCGVVMMALCLALIVSSVAGGGTRAAETAVGGEGAKEKPVYRNTVLVLVSFALYIVLMDWAGFAPATLLYLFTQMVLLHPGKPGAGRLVLYAGITVAATVSIYFLFNSVFHLILPSGVLF